MQRAGRCVELTVPWLPSGAGKPHSLNARVCPGAPPVCPRSLAEELVEVDTCLWIPGVPPSCLQCPPGANRRCSSGVPLVCPWCAPGLWRRNWWQVDPCNSGTPAFWVNVHNALLMHVRTPLQYCCVVNSTVATVLFITLHCCSCVCVLGQCPQCLPHACEDIAVLFTTVHF